ncbi:MAG: DNA-directed RNA polymerase subunit alpha C-terminal domain-containing protein [Gemmatimonadaceae bacterium]
MTLPTFVPARLNWFEEDLALLRQQRADLDARIQVLESRVAALRGYATQMAGDSSAPEPATSENLLRPMVVARAESIAVPTPAPRAEPAPTVLNAVAEPPVAYKQSIMSLGLETRTYNALVNNDIKSFAQLVATTPGQLRDMQGFGAGSLSDLERALTRVGHALAVEKTTARARPTRATSEHDERDQPSSSGGSALYDSVTIIPYQFGVIHAEDLQKMMKVSETDSKEMLRGDSRWVDANGGWYVRDRMPQSWIARRILEVLNAVKRVRVEALHQSIKRIAARKYTDEGWRMPSRALLGRIVESLRSEGVHFDIVHEMAHVDGTLEIREMSGTSRAVLQAFGANFRALSGADISAAIQASGMSEASANVALSTSPLVIKLERGIYGLVGRTATLRDIANARIKPAAEGGNSLPLVPAESGETGGHAEVPAE